MTTGPDLTKCLTFIGCQLGPSTHEGTLAQGQFRPAMTISRQTGVGSMIIARSLAEFLQQRAPAHCHWTVFDRNLVTKVLEEHGLPRQLARFLSEEHISRVRDIVEEVLGLHPPSEILLRQVAETVVHLAEMGHVILVGRAGHIITRHLKNVFHVRLVAPIEKRAEMVIARSTMDHQAALEYIRREDSTRYRYLKDFFKHDPDDPLLYDLVVNTGRLGVENAARLIGEALLEWAKEKV